MLINFCRKDFNFLTNSVLLYFTITNNRAGQQQYMTMTVFKEVLFSYHINLIKRLTGGEHFWKGALFERGLYLKGDIIENLKCSKSTTAKCL